MFKHCGLLILCLGSALSFYPMMNPMAGAYNSFWDGAVGGQGNWGDLPPRKANTFSEDWKTKGFNQIYNLNSMSPFGGDRFSGFDSMVPYYSPHGASRYTYYPTKSNFLSNGELGAFTYDINEPRYQELYKQYYRFFNKNLNRIQSQLKYEDKSVDLNNDQQRKSLNPGSFKYDNYFDGFDEANTLPGASLSFFPHKAKMDRDSSNRRGARGLQQLKNSNASKKRHISKHVNLKSEEAQKVIKKLEKRVTGMRKLISELEDKPRKVKKELKPRKLNIVFMDPEALANIDLKPYIFDSLAPHSLKPDYNRD